MYFLLDATLQECLLIATNIEILIVYVLDSINSSRSAVELT